MHSLISLFLFFLNKKNDSMHSDLFQKYDFGSAGNVAHYGTPTAPQYNVSNLITPTIVYAGGLDTVIFARNYCIIWTHHNSKINNNELRMHYGTPTAPPSIKFRI